MTASLERLSGPAAYDLIYPRHLAMLPVMDQETMHRHMHNSSRCWIGRDGDQILCFLGVIPPTLLSDRAYLWLYTTEHLREHVFIFVRYSQRVIAEILEQYPIIVGHAALGSDRSIRWLRWLGAEFGHPEGNYLPFEIRAT